MLDIGASVSQHKTARMWCRGNPTVNSDVVYYITMAGTVTLLCDFCINMALRSEA